MSRTEQPQWDRICAVRLPDDIFERLDDDAVSRCESRSDAIRRILRDHLGLDPVTQRKPTVKRPTPARKRTRTIASRANRERASDARNAEALVDARARSGWSEPVEKPEVVCGVYRLLKAGRTVYIGQSIHVHLRAATHATDKDFDSYAYLVADVDELLELERALIAVEGPPLNSPVKTGGTR